MRTFLLCALACGLQLLSGCGGSSSGGGSGTIGTDPPGEAPVVESFAPASASTASAGELVQFAVNVEAGQLVTFRWTINGVELPAVENHIEYQPQGGASTVDTIIVDITSESGETTSIVWTLSVIADDANQPPAITAALPPGPVSIAPGDSATFSVTASDPDNGDQIVYAWRLDGAELPGGGSSLTLAAVDLLVGMHTVRVTVTDGNEQAGEEPEEHVWEVTVLQVPPANRPPLIESAAPQGAVTITAGSSLTFRVTASDPDGDALICRWTLDGSPLATQELSWTYSPGTAQIGAHVVAVEVDDQVANSAGADPVHSWSVTVAAAPPPTPPPPPSEPATVQLAWDAVTADTLGNPESVSGYRVYVAGSPDAFQSPATQVSATTAAVNNLNPGATYYFAVTAFDAAGNESSFSQWISFQVP